MNRRDDHIGDALEQLDVPDHAPDFFARLDVALSDIDTQEAPVTTLRRPRRNLRFGIAAGVAALAVATYTLATLPPGTVSDRIADRFGPQVASAAEVTEQVKRAVAEVRTLRGV
ncbi:MAG: hypothetical protein Q8K89_02150, partial [Actinomycetota bacterium]|nr:hypothetical protein [Actinomycetota bacterium]